MNENVEKWKTIYRHKTFLGFAFFSILRGYLQNFTILRVFAYLLLVNKQVSEFYKHLNSH